MRKKTLLVLFGSICLILILAVLPFMAACVEPAPPPAPPRVYEIGASLPFNSTLGVEAKKCYELIVDMVNEKGGLVVKGERYNLKMIIYDDKYTAEGGRAVAERLVYQDGVNHIFTLGSAPTLAALPVTELGKVAVWTTATNNKVLDPLYHYTIRASNTGTDVAAGFGALMARYPDVKTVVALAQDTETGRGAYVRWKACFNAYGLDELKTIYFPANETEFSAITMEVKRLNPDLLCFVATTGETQLGLQLKSLYEAGWKGLKYASPSIHVPEVSAVCSVEAMENAIASIFPQESGQPGKAAQELYDAYVAKYGTYSDVGVFWVPPIYAFLAAVEKADSFEVDDIIAVLPGLKVDTSMGELILGKRPDLGSDRYCDGFIEQPMGILRNGKVEFLFKLSAEGARDANEKIFGGGSWK